MLVDTAIVHIRSGRGGNGANTLRREKYVPKGGPDGGDGGDGGDVIFVADEHLDTLIDFVHQPHRRATAGEHGGRKGCHGRRGEDAVVRVPVGTLVYDAETGELLADLTEHGQRWLAAKGGKGGLGNLHFKSATHQTPREFTPGGEAVERSLRLELKLIADVGIIGRPNAGKSTLLSVISKATPKIADYPFTTLTPQVGVAELPGERRLVMADIPGLIEGASAGAGLGHDFLRHIERTRALLHLVEAAPADGTAPAENLRAVRRELAAYSPELAAKPELVVMSKIDLLPPTEREARLAALAEAADGAEVCAISAATREGIDEMLERAWALAGKRAAPAWSE